MFVYVHVYAHWTYCHNIQMYHDMIYAVWYNDVLCLIIELMFSSETREPENTWQACLMNDLASVINLQLLAACLPSRTTLGVSWRESAVRIPQEPTTDFNLLQHDLRIFGTSWQPWHLLQFSFSTILAKSFATAKGCSSWSVLMSLATRATEPKLANEKIRTSRPKEKQVLIYSLPFPQVSSM